eukprot:1137222-Pelagomonas_calceolata.AAC.21
MDSQYLCPAICKKQTFMHTAAKLALQERRFATYAGVVVQNTILEPMLKQRAGCLELVGEAMWLVGLVIQIALPPFHPLSVLNIT